MENIWKEALKEGYVFSTEAGEMTLQQLVSLVPKGPLTPKKEKALGVIAKAGKEVKAQLESLKSGLEDDDFRISAKVPSNSKEIKALTVKYELLLEIHKDAVRDMEEAKIKAEAMKEAQKWVAKLEAIREKKEDSLTEEEVQAKLDALKGLL